MKKPPKPPADLSREARKKWAEVQENYRITDVTGLDYLSAGYRHYDRIQEARAIIKAEGAVVRDRFGQLRANPACVVERDSTAAMLKCFKALNLDFDAPGPVGRPEIQKGPRR